MNNKEFEALPPLVTEYLTYLETILNKSKLTVDGYALDLRIFFRYMLRLKGLVSDEVPFNEIDISKVDAEFISSLCIRDAHNFLKYCIDERCNDASARARKAVAIKRFYRYLHAHNKIDENPMQELDLPKVKKALPRYLTLEQSLDLLGCIDGKFRERDYCIITLFLNCGIRLSELVGLNLNSIRADNTLLVTGKGNKERIVYLNDACLGAIERYLRVRPADGLKDRKALFISRNKCRISARGVQDIVNNFLDKAGLSGQGFSTHKLRHTAATLMYRYGNVDVLLLKEILGHENLSTTEIYTHVSNEQLRNATMANPLSNVSPPRSPLDNSLAEDEEVGED